MRWLTTVWVWIKMGWPIAREVIEVVRDGRVTTDEVHGVIDRLFGEDHTLVLWGPEPDEHEHV